MNRALLGAVGAVLLAVMLVISVLGGLRVDWASDDRALQALSTLNKFSAIQTALRRDVLLVRAGLLADYDPLVMASDRMDGDLRQLDIDVLRDHLDDSGVHALAGAIAGEESLVERFKSQGAVMRNSLSYLPMLAASAVAEPGGETVASPVEALSQSVLRLLVEDTAEAAREVRRRVDTVSALQAPSPALGPTLHHLAAHAQLLGRLLPEVDESLRGIMENAVPVLASRLREQIQARSIVMAARARTARIAFDAVLLTLLSTLTIISVVNLRRSRLDLEELAATDKMIARISTLFVACEPERIGEALDKALGIIGRQIQLDRISVARPEPERLHGWTRDGVPLPAGHGRRLLALIDEEGVEEVVHRSTLPAAGSASRLLAGTGTSAVAAIRLRSGERTLGVLAFEATHPNAVWPRSGMTPLRSAANMFEKAIEQERVAAERDALQARLRQAQRLETAGALASGMAHNLNNIVGAVLGHAEMASECLARGDSPSEHVSGIRQAGERATELVENMLNFGRSDLPRDAVAISGLVDETLSLLRVSLPLSVTLTTENEAGDATVVGRSAELQQVMLNLIRNAVQSVDGAGHVTLRLARGDLAAARDFAVGRLDAGNHLVMSVSDTGSGMDETTVGHIFEPFYTTRPAGTGLGLATVADIVRDHGGAIDVRSTRGSGSTFEVWLPCGAAVETCPSGRGSGEIVLFVETEHERLLKVEEIVAALGYEPMGCQSVQEATDKLRQAPALIDAVLIYPSGNDGWDVLDTVAAVRAAHPSVPVAIVGGGPRTSRQQDFPPGSAVIVEPRSGAVGLDAALRRLFDMQYRTQARVASA